MKSNPDRAGQEPGAAWPRLTKGSPLPPGLPVRVAGTFRDRLIGLMFRRRPPPYALQFPGTRAVHTCFVRFPIDVAALDRDGRVLAVRQGVPPWRIVVFPKGTAAVVEIGTVPPPGEGAAAENTIEPLRHGRREKIIKRRARPV